MIFLTNNSEEILHSNSKFPVPFRTKKNDISKWNCKSHVLPKDGFVRFSINEDIHIWMQQWIYCQYFGVHSCSKINFGIFQKSDARYLQTQSNSLSTTLIKQLYRHPYDT